MTLQSTGKISHKDIMTEYSHPRNDFKLSGDGAPILSRPTNAQVKESDFYGLSASVPPPVYGGTINGMTGLPSQGGNKPQFKMEGGTAAMLQPAPAENVAYGAHGRQNYASSTGGVTGGRYLYDINNLFNGQQGEVPNKYSDTPYLIGPCLDGRNLGGDIHHTALKHGGDSQYGRPHILYRVQQDGSLGGVFLELPNTPDLPQGGQGHQFREFMASFWPKHNVWVWGGFRILKANDGSQSVSYKATISFIRATGGVLQGPFDLQSAYVPFGDPSISVAGDYAFGFAGSGGTIRKWSSPGSSYETLSPIGNLSNKYEWDNMFFFKGKYYSVNGAPGVGNTTPWRVSSFTGTPQAVTGWPSGWKGRWGFTSRDGTVACIQATDKTNPRQSRWFWSTTGDNWQNIGGTQGTDIGYGFTHTP